VYPVCVVHWNKEGELGPKKMEDDTNHHITLSLSLLETNQLILLETKPFIQLGSKHFKHFESKYFIQLLSKNLIHLETKHLILHESKQPIHLESFLRFRVVGSIDIILGVL
jgi:hypothetical protein